MLTIFSELKATYWQDNGAALNTIDRMHMYLSEIVGANSYTMVDVIK